MNFNGNSSCFVQNLSFMKNVFDPDCIS